MPMKRILIEWSGLCQADSQTDRINRTLVNFGYAIDVADQELESELEAERIRASPDEQFVAWDRTWRISGGSRFSIGYRVVRRPADHAIHINGCSVLAFFLASQDSSLNIRGRVKMGIELSRARLRTKGF